MRWLPLPLLALLGGCQACPAQDRHGEAQAGAVLPARAVLGAPLGPAPAEAPAPADLAALWQLALTNNPALREAAAEVEAARGRQIQASKYPTPQFTYLHDTLGNKVSPPGTYAFEVSQQLVTAGKRRLDVTIAARGTDAASLHAVGRRFEVLTRLRRA